MNRIVPDLASIKEILNKSKLFILDLDGTIADTETLHWEAYNILMRELYSIELEKSNICKYIGNSEINIYRMIEKDFNIKIDDSFFLKKRLEIYLSLVDSRKLMPMKWVKQLFKTYNKAKFVLLTSQVPEIVDYLFSKWELDKYIPKNMRISAHNGKITKKDFFKNPSAFININSNEIKNAVVFEDSNHVAKIASEFGYITIGIRNKFNQDSLIDFTYIIDESIELKQ